MAHTADKRASLRTAYAFQGQPLDRAAALAGVSAGTAARWKREAKKSGDDWDRVRSAGHLSGEGFETVARQMLADYIVQHKALMEHIGQDADMDAAQKVDLLSSLADSFAKTIAASRRVLPETDRLATALDVIRKLADFTRADFPQHAAALLEVLEPFGVTVARDFGK